MARSSSDSFSQSLSKFFIGRIAELFDQSGLRHIPFEQHLDYVQPLLNQCDEMFPFKHSAAPMRISNNYDDETDSETLRTQLSEELIISEKLPAEIRLFRTVPRTEWDSYVSKLDDEAVVFIIARIKERVLNQYVFSIECMEVIENFESDYMVFMRKRVVTNGKNCIRICLFDSPRQIEVTDKILKKGMLASISMLLLSHKGWQKNWQPAISKAATQTVLFDLSPLDHLQRSLSKSFDKVYFQKVQINISARELTSLIFLGKSTELTSIFFAPCSGFLADSVVDYIRNVLTKRNVNDVNWLEDPNRIEEFNRVNRLMLHCLYTQEIQFDFKALQTEFAKEGFKNDLFGR